MQFFVFDKVDVDVDVLNSDKVDDEIVELIRNNSVNFNNNNSIDDDNVDLCNKNMNDIIDNNALDEKENCIFMQIHCESDENMFDNSNLNYHEFTRDQNIFEQFNFRVCSDHRFRMNIFDFIDFSFFMNNSVSAVFSEATNTVFAVFFSTINYIFVVFFSIK